MMTIAMSTCDRSPCYLEQTIQSMFEQAGKIGQACLHQGPPVKLHVSGSDADWIPTSVRKQPVRIVVPSYDLSPYDAVRRTTINFVTALVGSRHRLVERDPVLFLEDDLKFGKDWYRRLVDAVAHHEKRRSKHPTLSSRYCISLYSTMAFRASETPLARFGKKFLWYGNQAVYFSEKAREAVLDYYDRVYEPNADLLPADATCLPPADMLLKHAMEHEKIDVYVCNPNLVQHIGAESSLGSPFHQTHNFEE